MTLLKTGSLNEAIEALEGRLNDFPEQTRDALLKLYRDAYDGLNNVIIARYGVRPKDDVVDFHLAVGMAEAVLYVIGYMGPLKCFGDTIVTAKEVCTFIAQHAEDDDINPIVVEYDYIANSLSVYESNLIRALCYAANV